MIEGRNYLNSFKKFRTDKNFKPGPERVETILSMLGNPHKNLKIIHIAGTNGKGSTATMVSSIMQAAGYRTGVFLSPHLHDIKERFLISGKQISEREIKAVVKKIKPGIEKAAVNSRLGRPILFEVLTILAFQYFADEDVDVVVLEAGMGGRLDPTNVVSPIISLITSVGFDHTEYLGDTLSKIAKEKAGIIKEKTPVVTGVVASEPLRVIKKTAKENNAPLFCPLQEACWTVKEENLCRQKLDLIVSGNCYRELVVGLVGEHQILNTILAVRTAEIIAKDFKNINKKTIYQGLQQLALPGRLELMREKPVVLLDSAHNSEGIKALVKFLQKKKSHYNNLIFILSILQDKDFISMIKYVVPAADKIIFTENSSSRTIKASELAAAVNLENTGYLIINKLIQAIEETITAAETDDLICITGSLKTAAEARNYFTNKI